MNENDKAAKKSIFPKSIRIIALILAVLLLGEVVLSSSVAVSFSSRKYDDSQYEQAAKYIERNDSYLTAGKLSRMRAAVSMLGEAKTYEQLSLFASVAIADEDYAGAADYLIKAVAVCKDERELPYAYLKIGCLMALSGSWSDAATYFNRSLALDEANPDAWLMLTEAYLNGGDYEKAYKTLETYSSFEALSPEEFDALIQLKINLEKYEDALADCDKAERDGSLAAADIALYRGQINYGMGDYAAALEQARKCRDAGGDLLKAGSLIALCCEEIGDYQTALDTCLDLIGRGLADLTLYQLAAQDAYLLSDHETVIRVSEEALKKYGESGDALVFQKWLGLSYFESNDLVKAEQSLTVVIDSGESMPELNYLRGICEMGSERYAEAVSDFSLVLSDPELADEALYNRGLCYIQLGDNEAAAVDFQAVIDRNSDEEVIALICDLLDISQEQLEASRQVN